MHKLINILNKCNLKKLFAIVFFIASSTITGTVLVPWNGLPLSPFELFYGFTMIILLLFAPWTRYRRFSHVLVSFSFALFILSLIGHFTLNTYGWSVCVKRGIEIQRMTTPCEPSVQFKDGSKSFIYDKITFDNTNVPVYFMNDGTVFNYWGSNAPDRKHLPYELEISSTITNQSATHLNITSSSSETTITINAKKIELKPNSKITIPLEPHKENNIKITYKTLLDNENRLVVDTDGIPFYALPPAFFAQSWYVSGFRIVYLTLLMLLALLLISLTFITLFTEKKFTVIKFIIASIIASFFLALANIQNHFFFSVSIFTVLFFYLYLRPASKKAFLPFALLALLAFTMIFISHTAPPNACIAIPGGTDMLTHETMARSVLTAQNFHTFIEGGEKGIFYYQPLYRYFLALFHSVLGEPLWGPFVLQTMLFIFVFYLTLKLFFEQKNHFGGAIVGIGLILATSHPVFSLYRLALLPMQQSIGLPILLLSFLYLLLLILRNERRILPHIFIGVGFGLAVSIRNDYVPIILTEAAYILYYFFKNKNFDAPISLFLGTLIFPCIVILRNYLVSGELFFFTTASLVNLVPEFNKVFPYEAYSKNTGLKTLIGIVAAYRNDLGALVTILYNNVVTSFIGTALIHKILWYFGLLSFPFICVLKNKMSKLILTFIVLFVFSLMIPSAFFVQHNAGAMLIQYDYSFIIVMSFLFGSLLHYSLSKLFMRLCKK